MGILGRLGSLVRANVDDLITQSEDPEKMLSQALREMAVQLVDIRKKVIVAAADERRFRQDWQRELERARHWKERAMMAVRHGEDGLAKEALLRRREHEALAEEYQRQWEAQRRGVDQLRVALQALDHKIRDARHRRGLLLAKLRRAEAQKAIQETLSGLETASAFETLDRIERRVEQMEAEADAAAELNEQMTGDVLRQRFAALEAGEVDVDLLDLKAEMGLLPRGEPTVVALLEANAGRGRPSRSARGERAAPASTELVPVYVDEGWEVRAASSGR
jgi:phage shock protein A